MSVNRLRHLAIIPDGNRRWSRRNGRTLEWTYVEGSAKMFQLSQSLLGRMDTLEELSLFFVSSENLRSRDRTELDPLFSAGHHFLDLLDASDSCEQIDLRWIGLLDHDFDIDSTNYESLISRIRMLESKSREGRRINILFGYDVRRDIERACAGESRFEYERLSVNKPVDLIVRTGGHRRLSGFLPLVCQYSEFEFIERLFPDVDEREIWDCIDRFQNSDRHFGG